jgi:hypothetical protein
MLIGRTNKTWCKDYSFLKNKTKNRRKRLQDAKNKSSDKLSSKILSKGKEIISQIKLFLS